KVEVAIKYVDFAAVEVRRQKKRAVYQAETFVNRPTGCVIKGNCGCVAGAGPVGDDAIFSVKNKLPTTKVAAIAVCHGARGTTRAAIAVWIVCGPGYRYDEGS